MLMPIVSMNKMAMNESVAATCCYREVASPTNVYWEVLNGGWIGAGYVEDLGWVSEYCKSWAVLPYDVKGIVSNATYAWASVPTIGKHTYVDTFGDTVTDWWIDGALAADWISAAGLKKGDTCSHADGTCVYRVWDISYKSNQHFESKTKHDTAPTKWQNPHTAKQFAS